MFPEHLRQRSQRGEVGEGVVGSLAREAPDAAGGSQGSSQPLMSDMLKRKRVSSRQKAGRKTGASGGGGSGSGAVQEAAEQGPQGQQPVPAVLLQLREGRGAAPLGGSQCHHAGQEEQTQQRLQSSKLI